MKFEHQDQCEWSRMEGQTKEVGSENLVGIAQEYPVMLGDTVAGFASVNCGEVKGAMDICVGVCEI